MLRIQWYFYESGIQMRKNFLIATSALCLLTNEKSGVSLRPAGKDLLLFLFRNKNINKDELFPIGLIQHEV